MVLLLKRCCCYDVACGLHTVNGILATLFINLELEKLGMSKFLFGSQSICW